MIKQKQPISPVLFVFVALPCEAKPLIEQWGLKKHQQKHPYTLYFDEERVVVITGVGKVAMAGAVGYVMAYFKSPTSPILLNLGIGGHLDLPVGSICLASKIVDAETSKSIYPQGLPETNCLRLAVKTLARPSCNYEENFVYDMEAAGFVEMAVKFSTLELIHCVKIISDNTASPIENIDQMRVGDWISKHVSTIVAIINACIGLRNALQPCELNGVYEQLLLSYHLSVTNEIRLRKLLLRHQLLIGADSLDFNAYPTNNVNVLLQRIGQELTELEFKL